MAGNGLGGIDIYAGPRQTHRSVQCRHQNTGPSRQEPIGEMSAPLDTRVHQELVHCCLQNSSPAARKVCSVKDAAPIGYVFAPTGALGSLPGKLSAEDAKFRLARGRDCDRDSGSQSFMHSSPARWQLRNRDWFCAKTAATCQSRLDPMDSVQ